MKKNKVLMLSILIPLLSVAGLIGGLAGYAV